MKEKKLMKVLTGIFMTVMCLNGVSGLRANEVMYNPSGTDSGREWIEIYNDGDADALVSDYRLYENEINHIIAGVDSDVLAPGEYAVITTSQSDFLADYPSYSGKLFLSSFSLVNTGESIAIKNSTFETVSEITYTGDIANGNNKSVEWVDGMLYESLADGGTPGVQNSQGTQVPEFSGLTITMGALIALAGVFLIRRRL